MPTYVPTRISGEQFYLANMNEYGDLEVVDQFATEGQAFEEARALKCQFVVRVDDTGQKWFEPLTLREVAPYSLSTSERTATPDHPDAGSW